MAFPHSTAIFPILGLGLLLISLQSTTNARRSPRPASSSSPNKKMPWPASTSHLLDSASPQSHQQSSAIQFFATGEDEERLSIDLFKGYNSLIRPSPCHNQTVVNVDFGMAMILLINVDEKNQIMQSNAWLTLKWNDCQFSEEITNSGSRYIIGKPKVSTKNWDPTDYGGIESIRVPVERVWVPDIVLFNNADGNYEVSYQSNVVVDYQGNVSWVPPAIYKSSCRIDVEYFPFDEQTCVLQFGSWTYGPSEVQLRWYGNKKAVELEDYSPSGIWDIMDVPGRMAPDKSRVEFHIVIRRKTLFYTVILIIPTVLMAFLSMLVFYLPAECSEKITLAISILLALVVFLLLVSKILPPTSDTIPLMAKYLLMTFVMNIITIMSTVCVLNVHFRSALTHQMPNWVRILFLGLLPRLLCMRRPWRPSYFRHSAAETTVSLDQFSTSSTLAINQPKGGGGHISDALPGMAMAGMLPFVSGRSQKRRRDNMVQKERRPNEEPQLSSPGSPLPQLRRSQTGGHLGAQGDASIGAGTASSMGIGAAGVNSRSGVCAKLGQLVEEQKMGQRLRQAVESIAFIAEHIRTEMSDKKVRDDWRFISTVIDRLLLLIFFGITLGGTVAILFSVPHVFELVDQQQVIRRLIAKNKLEAMDGH